MMMMMILTLTGIAGVALLSFTCISATFLLNWLAASSWLLLMLVFFLFSLSSFFFVFSTSCLLLSSSAFFVVVVFSLLLLVVPPVWFPAPPPPNLERIFLPLKVDWIFSVAASTALASSSVSMKSTPSVCCC